LSMEDPSTIRRAETDMGGAPYGGDSLAGQTGGNTDAPERKRQKPMEQCTLSVLGSQYVLLRNWVLSVFNPLCPNLNFGVS
jgi:hypothetical protein